MGARIIYCPSCQRRVASWDGRSTIDVIANCRKCNRQIIYRIATEEIEVKKIPVRGTSSGITFR